jgi:hypothetical protein
MAKDRVQVGPLAPPPKIIPQARPVDTFHRPDEALLPTGPSQTRQLVEALGGLQPSLNRYADVAMAEETQKQLSAGEQAVLADQRYQNRRALKDAVASGKIPAAQNPWFLQGMRQQVYRIEGEKYDVALRKAYAESDSRNNEDISDFVGSFTSKYLEGVGADPSDPETARILTPLVERANANVIDRHRAERDQAHEQAVEDNTSIEIGLQLDKMGETGGSPEDYAHLANGVIQEHMQNGLDGTKANQILAQAIRAKAEDSLDTNYWNVLDHVKTGSGTVAQIAAIKEMRRASEERIFHQLEENDRVSSKKTKDDREAATRATLGSVFQKIIDNPSTDIKDDLKVLADSDPVAAEKAYGWQQAQINGADNIVEDQPTATALTGKVYSGNGDLSEVMDAQRLGLINAATAKDLAKNIERSKEFRTVLRDPTINELHKSLGQQIRGSDSTYTEANAINGARAQNQFLKALMTYKKDYQDSHNGSDPSDLDMLKYGRDYQQQLIEIYAPDAVDQASETMKLDAKSALLLDPEQVDWNRKPILTSQDITEYNTNKGQTGTVVDLAQHLNVDVRKLYMAQLRIHQAEAAKPKPKK